MNQFPVIHPVTAAVLGHAGTTREATRLVLSAVDAERVDHVELRFAPQPEWRASGRFSDLIEQEQSQ